MRPKTRSIIIDTLIGGLIVTALMLLTHGHIAVVIFVVLPLAAVVYLVSDKKRQAMDSQSEEELRLED